MENNVIVRKSYRFSVKAVKFCFEMQKQKKEFVISKQLLKSATSIGANIQEAQGAISKAEFIAKTQIALKEAKETKYWICLIIDAAILDSAPLHEMQADCGELILILTSILKTAKSR